VSDVFTMPGRSVAVLAAWCVASVAAASWALRRRT
jgi:protein-tyrosine phosphatase